MKEEDLRAWAFYREVAARRVVWTLRDEQGFLIARNSYGKCAQPFWSSQRRVQGIVDAPYSRYRNLTMHPVAWEDFRSTWVPELIESNCLVGVNWSGEEGVGYDLEPEHLARNVQAMIDGLR